jgi:hypothetical protein
MQDKPEQPPDTLTRMALERAEYWKAKEGKCITCGFAAKQARMPIGFKANPAWYEIPFDERQGGKVLLLSSGTGNARSDTYDIACFRGKVDLLSLVNELEGQRPGAIPAGVRETYRLGDSLQVLEETSCDYWYPYEPGRTPQEHLSDFMWEQLEKQREEHEEEREKDRRAFEERMEKERREFDTRLTLQLEKDRRQFESNLEARLEIDRRGWIEQRDNIKGIAEKTNKTLVNRLMWAAIIIGIANVIAAILAMTKDSWIVQVFKAWFGHQQP